MHASNSASYIQQITIEAALPHDEQWDVTTLFDEMITRGEIGPLEWAVIFRGGDTADAGNAELYEGTEKIDHFRGGMGRLGYDTAAYLERYHGIVVDPTSPKMRWGGESTYNPGPDLRNEDPERTLTGTPPEPPFEFGNDDAYFRIVGETEKPETVCDGIDELGEKWDLLVEETTPSNPTPNRLRFDFESTYIGSVPTRWQFIEDNPITQKFTWLVIVQGSRDTCQMNVEAPVEEEPPEWSSSGPSVSLKGIDSKIGDSAGLIRYLEKDHEVTVDATAPSVSEIPDDAEMPDEEPDHGRLSEHLEKRT